MDGQYLNRFIEWIDTAIKSDESFISDDIDWFIDDPISKKEWLLLGFSLWTLAKEILKSRELDYIVELGLTLDERKKPNIIPEYLTDRIFRNVMPPPTIYISKDKEYITKIYGNPNSSFKEINGTSLGIPCKCRVFYHEMLDSSEQKYYRSLYFM